MIRRLRLPLLIFIVVGVATAVFFFWRSRTAAQGAALALCPGPDLYGYTCASGEGFAYIDATNDTFLYADDGVVQLELPFPFTFYGTTYNQINASSNGTLQFTTSNNAFFNECLTEQPAANMGDMIAPYWDDLNLLYAGYLEYELVGDAPNRIFVIEWDDVPRYGDDESDQVTFAVQLFEGSNDILFLYGDATTYLGNNGSSATIGLQSEQHGVSLQYGCNQAVVANASKLHFPHPDNPNRNIGATAELPTDILQPPYAKGHVADLLTRLNQQGTAVLPQMRQSWLNGRIPRTAEWQLVDMDDNGRSELLVVWHSTAQHPQASQIALFTNDEQGGWSLTYEQTLSTRAQTVTNITILDTVDLTHDGRPDLLLHDGDNGRYWLLTYPSTTTSSPLLSPIPEQCNGRWLIADSNADGRVDFIRNNCHNNEGRTAYTYHNGEWLAISDPQ